MNRFLLLFLGLALIIGAGILTGQDPVHILSVASAGCATFAVRDSSLKSTRALPNGAATVNSATGIDLGHLNTKGGRLLAEIEFLLTYPTVTTSQLADTTTITYSIITSASSDMSSPTVLMPGIAVQTGASSAGATGGTYRFRLPTDCQRYVGLRAVKTGAADASAATATLEMLF